MSRRIELAVVVIALFALAPLIDPLTPEGFVALAIVLLLYAGYMLTDGWPVRSRVMFMIIGSIVPGFVIIAALVLLWRRRRQPAAIRET
jgi:hypothetical protein